MLPDDETDDKTFDLDEIEDEVEVEEEVEAAEEDEDDPEPEPQRRQPGRRESEIIKLRKRAQDAERDAKEARELALRASGSVETLTRTFQQPRVDPRVEQERIANMSEREYTDYTLQNERRQLQDAFGSMQFRMEDQADAGQFDRDCRKNDVYAKIADEVEERIMKLRNQGQNVSRRTMANQILGEKAAAKATRKPTEREPARRATRTGYSSDVAVDRTAQRGAKGKTAKDRLKDVTF